MTDRIKRVASSAVSSLARIGADPADDEDLRLKKSLLVLGSALFMLAGYAWGILYFLLGAGWAAAIPFLYGVFSLISLTHFSISRRYRLFRSSQLVLVLLLPFILMLALGGFVHGSAVILWALVGPMGATLFDEPRRAPLWFMAFIALTVIAGVIQPWLTFPPPLSPGVETMFFVLNLLGVGTIIFLMVLYFVGQKNAFQEKSEALLLNILPKEIAAVLRGDHHAIADHYDGASVLFADLVGFTPMSATMSPSELVGLLDEVFSRFDELAETYDVEKIKTIGDCYMVAAGVPRPRSDHAEALTRLALEMCDCIKEQNFGGRKLSFRIGINSGPVVAGVIGRKKFIYDLWGDAVNTASRMETHGEGGRIQIARATYEIIRDRFVCEPRGTIEVKGLGATETWFVTGERLDAAAEPQ